MYSAVYDGVANAPTIGVRYKLTAPPRVKVARNLQEPYLSGKVR